MAFQERMSNTSYQRAVGDMQAAGLNPMLAYSQGGASAPIGSMPRVENEAGAGMASASQGAAIAQAMAGLLKTKADTDFVAAQADKTRSETLDQKLNTAAKVASTEKDRQSGNLDYQKQLREAMATALDEVRLSRDKESFSADVSKRKYESSLKGLEIPAMQAEAEYWKKMESAPKEVKFFLDLIQQIFGIRNSIRR
jgi:hypothetical protein